MVRTATLISIFGVLGCGGDDGGPDAAPDAPIAHFGPVVELPLRPPIDPAYPAQHSHEASIAARGGRVVVAYVNRNLLSADSYEDNPGAPGGGRQVAIATSDNSGETFVLAEPDLTDGNFSDPIVRVTSQGTFWLVRLRIGDTYNCAVSKSTDGFAWTAVEDVPCSDKPWLAVDPLAAWIAADAGMARVPADGSPRTLTSMFPAKAIGGFADATGAHMLGLLDASYEYRVIHWDAVSDPVVEIDGLAGGVNRDSLFSMFCAAAGRTLTGDTWILRTVFTDGAPRAVLYIRSADSTEVEIAVNEAGTVAFFPSGAIDSQGRLHVMWYETSGPAGALKYARSRSADLTAGFGMAAVVDPDALPGNGWFPTLEEIRRLREYVELTVDADRAYLAWTHAPEPPSRVRTTWAESLEP